MDSTIIASNIQEMTCLQLLVEALPLVHRMAGKADRERSVQEFALYLTGSSGQYVYRLTGEEQPEHLQRTGELMERLQDELGAEYLKQSPYRMRGCVHREHCIVEETRLHPNEDRS